MEMTGKQVCQMVERMEQLPSEDRWKRLGLSLREGKAERHLSEVYQVTEVVDSLNEELLFTHTCITRYRWQPTKLIGSKFKGDERKRVLLCTRVANSWNLLTKVVMEAQNVSRVREELDKFLDNGPISRDREVTDRGVSLRLPQLFRLSVMSRMQKEARLHSSP